MAARWIALIVGGITLTIVGFFVAVAFWPRAEPIFQADVDSSPRAEPRQMVTSPWIIAAQFEQLSVGVETTLSIRDDAGAFPADLRSPTAEFRMLDMDMSPVAAVLEQESSGMWRSLTRLPMPGRWSFVVTVEEEEVSFPFLAPAG